MQLALPSHPFILVGSRIIGENDENMIEEGRYCIDVVTQISAVRAALRRTEEEVLRDHVAHCVEHAIESGNADDSRAKVAELMNVLTRIER